MLEQYYSIAGERILIKSRQPFPITMFKNFECEASDDVMLTLEVDADDSYMRCYGFSYFQCPDGWSHVLIGNQGESKILASKDWSELKLMGDGKSQNSWMELLAAGFYSRLTSFGGVLMHASVVEYKNKAVVFTAASGTGKTTQARLWNEYLNGRILNGDKVFFKEKDNLFETWGSPWKGSSPYAINDYAPLGAVIVLSQGKDNIIRPLEDHEIASMVLPHIFLPSWDTVCIDRVMEVVNNMFSQIHFYHLSCRPDEDAVLVTRNKLEQDNVF